MTNICTVWVSILHYLLFCIFVFSVCKASKLACSGLDAVETRVPLITMGTQEVSFIRSLVLQCLHIQVRESGKKMYNESRVKKGVDRVVATKDYGVEKVSGAYNGVVANGKNGVKMVSDVICTLRCIVLFS